MSVFSDIKKAFRKANDAFNKAGRALSKAEDVGRELGDVDKKITGLVQKAERDFSSRFDNFENQFKGFEGDFKGFKDNFEGAVGQIGDRIEEAAKSALEAVIRAAASKSLGTALKLIDTIAPSNITLSFSVLSIDVGDVYDKIETIRRLAENAPGNSEEITQAVIDLAPESVSINLDIGLGLLLQSDALSFGFGMSWSTEDVLEHLPALLRECGVP